MAALITKLKYGAWITVSSTILLTGTWWYNRVNPSIRAQDHAELYAAICERNVAYQTGTESINLQRWPLKNTYTNWYTTSPETTTWYEYEGADTNQIDNIAGWLGGSGWKHNIHHMPYWSLMYNQILCQARTYTTAFPDQSDTVKIFWLGVPDIPKNGDVIAQSEANWYYTETTEDGFEWFADRVYNCTVSNAISVFPTADTRVPTPYTHFLSPYAGSRFPIPSLFYTSILSDTNIYSGAGNWWAKHLGYTNYPRYWCENEQVNSTNVVVEIELIAGAGYTLSEEQLVFPEDAYLVPQTLTITETGRSGNSAAVYKLTNPIYEDSVIAVAGETVNQYHCVAKFNPFGAAAMSYAIKDNATSLDLFIDGGANQGTVYLTYSGDLSGPASVFFSESEYPYAGQITVTCPQSSGGVIGMALDAYDPMPVTYVAIANPPDAYYEEIIVDPKKATIGASATRDFDVSVTNGPVSVNTLWFDRRIHTNNLNDARSVLTNLTTTIAYISNSEMVYGYSWQYNKTAFTNQPETAGDTVVAASDIWGWLCGMSGDVETIQSNEFNGVLGSCDLQVRSKHTEHKQTGNDTNTIRYASELRTTVNLFKDCMLPYPSYHALTSGLISKVSVYAVCGGSLPVPAVGYTYFTSTATNETRSWTHSNFTPQGLDACTFGLVSCLSEHKATDDPIVNDFHTHSTFDYDIERSSLYKRKLALLIEASNPSDYLVFDLGSDTLTPVYEDSQTLVEDDFFDFGWYTERIKTDCAKMIQTVTVEGFIVVVEWKFEHLNTFVPTDNKPLWATQ